MAQVFRVVERVYPKNRDWDKIMSAYITMTNVAFRIICEGEKEQAEPPEDDSGLVKKGQANFDSSVTQRAV